VHDWLVFIHILGAVGFLLAHGVSIAMALRLQGPAQRDLDPLQLDPA
jgi:hypothetical protein